MLINEYTKAYAAELRNAQCILIREQPIQLRSGGQSHIYVNHNNLLSRPTALHILAEAYKSLIEQRISDYQIGAVDSVMSPVLAGVLSTVAKKPIVVVKQESLAHGIQERVYGDPSGDIVLVDDMTSTGTLLISAAKELRRRGANVRFCVVAAYRDNTAHKILATEGVELLSLTSFRDIVEVLWHELSPHERALVSEEIHVTSP